MNVSKNILQGVLLGLSTIALTSVCSAATAQKPVKVCAKPPQPQDTVQLQTANVADTPQPVTEQNQVVQSGDSTELIYKHPCITCGRG